MFYDMYTNIKYGISILNIEFKVKYAFSDVYSVVGYLPLFIEVMHTNNNTIPRQDGLLKMQLTLDDTMLLCYCC